MRLVALSRAILAAPFLVAPGLAGSSAFAQTLPSPMPTTSLSDENGVDLINWHYTYEISPISIGPSDQSPLAVSVFLPFERDSFTSNLRIEDPSWEISTRVVASIGSKTWSFIGGGAVGDPGAQVVGPIYTGTGTDAVIVYARDGTVIEYEYPFSAGTVGPVNLCAARIINLNGEILTFYNKYGSVIPCRTQSIVSNRGYQIKYEYASSNSTIRSRVTLINNAYEYCDPMADTCSLSMSWPYISSSNSAPKTYTNHAGQSWVLTSSGLLSPGQTSPGISWTTQTYNPAHVPGALDWRVTSVTRDGGTWTYSYPSSDPVLGGGVGGLLRVQDPLGNVTRYRRTGGGSGGDPQTGEWEWPNLIHSTADQFGNIRSHTYDSQAQLTQVELPEGMRHVADYDSRGNMLTHTRIAKTGSGAADIVTRYTYGTFNDRPLTVTDANENTTEYTYDPVHGGVLTETRPAPTAGAPRPVTRYAYAQRYVWVRNSGGSYVQAASPLWVLDSERTCRTSATVGNACAAGASDEVTTTYDYGPNAGPNNLWLRGKAVTADGISHRTCYAYDAIGNRISETQPNAGLTSCP